ncbi:MAG: methyltransferase domain-containing protein [Verrucomicrobiota bacterium]
MSYESDFLHDCYVLFHYGSAEDILSGSAFSEGDLPKGALDFPVATVEAIDIEGPVDRALDVGCAVGRSAYELSRSAGEVIGIDFSQSFVDAASAIGGSQPYAYHRHSEMHLREPMSAHLPAGVNPERVAFEQGDAMNLRSDLGQFDVVHAANLLCRLPEPKKFLKRLADLVKPGGKFLITTPATWLEEYTPSENMPSEATLEFLKENLEMDFDLFSTEEIPFFIREHQRKFQLSTAQASLWVRKG